MQTFGQCTNDDPRISADAVGGSAARPILAPSSSVNRFIELLLVVAFIVSSIPLGIIFALCGCF